jgi:uncharacterized protein
MEISALTTSVLLLSFALAFIFGAAAQASNFCTMGAVADVANFGDWTRARLVLTAIAVAIAGTGALIFFSDVDLTKSIYASPKLLWLSHIVGGLVFGFGMTIASGCGSKTLLRVGGGSLKAVVTLVVMAIASYMTLKGLFAIFRVNILDKATLSLPAAQLLPSLLGLGKSAAFGFSVLVSGAIFAFVMANKDFRGQPKLLLAGALIGLTVVGGWWTTAQFGFVAEHPDTLQAAYLATNSNRPESFSFTAPVAYGLELLMLWSDKSTVLTFGIAAVLGMIAGGAVVALATKTFRWESFANAEDLANHLVGGMMMGFGGVTALGCTIGQGASGLSVLSLGAIITVIAIVIGSRLALRYQLYRIDKTS